MTIENVQLVQEELEALEKAHKQIKFDTSIPTLDVDVRLWLRRYGFPCTLFGENKGSRRTRLRNLFVKQGSKAPPALYEPRPTGAPMTGPSLMGSVSASIVETTMEEVLHEGQTEVFYTEGSNELLLARQQFTKSSVVMALVRNRLQKAERYSQNEQEEIAKSKQRVVALMKPFSLAYSRHGSNRSICSVHYCPTVGPSATEEDARMSDVLVTGGYSGTVSFWQGVDKERAGTIDGLEGSRIHALEWRPHCPIKEENNAVLASGRSTGNVSLHAVSARGRVDADKSMTGGEDEPEKESQYEMVTEKICNFDTAEARISDIKWHPLGEHIFASSYDGTWRLYDVAKEKELLLQEGHSLEICSLAVHPDGSLVASGDAGGIIRVWDLRTGRSVMTLEQHLRKVLALDFHPYNGCHLLSAGEDRTGLVWDIRRQQVHDRLLGHTKLISRARYDTTGEVIFTSGYDGIVKVWDSATSSCVKNLVAHQTLVMGMDFRSTYHAQKGLVPELATVGYDRSMKVWK